MNYAADARLLLLREIRTMQQEIVSLDDEGMLWRCPEGITNPIGTLGLHLAGNLRHFVGAGMGDTGYVRDREREFTARGLPAKAVIGELEQAAQDVSVTLAQVTQEALTRPFRIGGVEMPTSRFLLHLCSHAALHVGQAGYLRRMLTGSPASVGVTPMAALAD